MAATNRSLEKWTRDRRAGRRYEIDAELEYQLVRHRKVIQVGHGRTINLSSTGILFLAPNSIPPGMQIEMSIAWPARLNNNVSLKLWVSGRTVRSREDHVAARILNYEFRSRAASGSASAA